MQTEYRIVPMNMSSLAHLQFVLQFKDTIQYKKYWLFGKIITKDVWRFIPTIDHAIQNEIKKPADSPSGKWMVSYGDFIHEDRADRHKLHGFMVRYPDINNYFAVIEREREIVKEIEYLRTHP